MTLNTLKAKLLSDPDVKARYHETKPKFDVITEIIQLRRKLNLTQQQLADKAGIKQPQLARIEAGKQSPRLDTISMIALSVGYSVELRFIPINQPDEKDS